MWKRWSRVELAPSANGRLIARLNVSRDELLATGLDKCRIRDGRASCDLSTCFRRWVIEMSLNREPILDWDSSDLHSHVRMEMYQQAIRVPGLGIHDDALKDTRS